MNRRDFVKQLSTGMGAALTPGVLAAILTGCQAEPKASGLLTVSEMQILESLSEAIIPTTDTPGAIEAGVPEYIQMILEHFTPADQVDTFRSQLGWLSTWLADEGADSLEVVAEEKRNALLAALDDQAFGSGASDDLPSGEPALFAILKPLTVAGYYTSEIGATVELHQTPFQPYKDIPYDEVGKIWS